MPILSEGWKNFWQKTSGNPHTPATEWPFFPSENSVLHRVVKTCFLRDRLKLSLKVFAPFFGWKKSPPPNFFRRKLLASLFIFCENQHLNTVMKTAYVFIAIYCMYHTPMNTLDQKFYFLTFKTAFLKIESLPGIMLQWTQPSHLTPTFPKENYSF